MIDRRLSLSNELATAGRLFEAAQSKSRGAIYTALDQNGRPQAAIFCGWDQRTVYYLTSTRTAASGNGAVALLIWRAIQDAIASGKSFDFDRVAFAGSAPYLASFGAKCETRFLVLKLTPLYSAIRGLSGFILHRQGSLFDRIEYFVV